MIIKSKFKKYNVVFEKDLSFLKKLLKNKDSIFVIDKKVFELYKKEFSQIDINDLVLIDATENNKTIETALKICDKITSLNSKRNSTIISIGGGIIQDITGFVANITYRGINWIFVPTTLLACCDSCIGGKTSLNFKKYKNLLGTFYPPNTIHISPVFFSTLSERDYYSGLGEVVKFHLMNGNNGLEEISKDLDDLIKRKYKTIIKYVKKSLLFKKRIIEIDEFDQNERIKLNFAHTFGHAIETESNYKIPHGTAVAIGMIMADWVSYKRGLLDKEFVLQSDQILKRIIKIDCDIRKMNLNNVINSMKKDKKQSGKNIKAILLDGHLDQLIIINDLKPMEIKKAFHHFNDIYYN